MRLRRGALACTIARVCACSWRAMKHAVMLTEYMRTVYSQPDIDKARKHADAFLPKDRHGRLYPLSTPLKSFHSLGAGVALYMHMVHWWSLFFFAATLVSFSSLVLNMEGDGLDVTERNMYTIHSLGNAAHRHAETHPPLPLPWDRPSSAPVPPQGAPGGSGRLETPQGERPGHWAARHRLGCSGPLPLKSPIPLTHDHSVTREGDAAAPARPALPPVRLGQRVSGPAARRHVRGPIKG